MEMLSVPRKLRWALWWGVRSALTGIATSAIALSPSACPPSHAVPIRSAALPLSLLDHKSATEAARRGTRTCRSGTLEED